MDVAINGKFLGAPNNGVHRTAKHFTQALLSMSDLFANVRVYAPQKAFALPAEQRLGAKVVDALGSGQLWENMTLPYATRRHLLVNFCNLAPVLHPNYVVMIHDAQTYLYPEDYSGKQAAAYRRWMPVIGHRAKLVLTVSEFARDSLETHGISPREKVRVVYNGTDHILQVRPDPSLLSEVGVHPSQYVLCVGSTKGYKNLRVLFDALRDTPSTLPLVVAGGGTKQDFLDAGLAPPSNVRFTGRVTDEQLRALYENASVFVFPSKTEGFGLPPLEAMQCGCPVISARAGAMPEVCADGALFVSPSEPRAWREAIRAVLAAPLRSELVARGRARAGLFTWERAAHMLRDAIAEAAFSPGHAGRVAPSAA